MTTHRGINMSSVTGEGLQDLPGLLIAVFFVMAGTYLIRIWFIPLGSGAVDVWLLVAWILIAPAACVGYLIGHRRDESLTARLEVELHKLNETAPPGAGAAADTESEALREWHGELGLMGFRAEELRSAARPRGTSPEALLILVVVLLLFAGFVSMFAPMHEVEIVDGFATIAVGAATGYVFHRVRAWRDAKRIARELDQQSSTPTRSK